MNRRHRAALAALALLAVATVPSIVLPAVASPATPPLVAPTPSSAVGTGTTTTPIQHFVMVMQAGHSFDNYFGTYPGAEGTPPGTCSPLDTTTRSSDGCVRPYRLGTEPPEVLDETATVQQRQLDGGRMDGFVAAYRKLGRDGTTSMGYYDGADLPYYWNVADEYTLFDHFFSSARSGPRLNAFYWVAGVPTPNGSEAVPPGGYGDIPTIFDRLEARGVTWKFYVENLGRGAGSRARSSARVPLAGFARFVDDPRLSAHIVDLAQYDTDLAAGTLPAVSYVVSGGSSESPPGRVAAGQMLIRSMVSGLQKSRYWSESAFLWTYDGWGGFYDHVPPPSVDAFGYGFRVPALLVSPYSRRGAVDHTTLDYTAALRFVEDNWGLPRLGARDATSSGMTSAFDFGSPPRPPELLGLDRPLVPDGSRARWAVYLSYGGALLFAAAAAWLPGRIRRRARVPEEVG